MSPIPGLNMRDGQVSPAAFALPNAASGSTASLAIDTQNIDGDFVALCELVITAPALNMTQLPDTRTVTYTLQQSIDNANWTTEDPVFTQTGAGGAGAIGQTTRRRLPTNVQRYIRLQATTGVSTGDCSGVNAQLDMLF